MGVYYQGTGSETHTNRCRETSGPCPLVPLPDRAWEDLPHGAHRPKDCDSAKDPID
jgi:hypothetical protein